ncbi:MAG: transketolase C-terminal domain-containing protein [Gemmatimonadota bacterium]|nr:transketolase C-terminal domain-containing protein [Gemmatimonadota bacterium]|tara:strand:+ start:4663 stop:5658 length:996 start_codon:yes stop_codon:yes gene_type:complete
MPHMKEYDYGSAIRAGFDYLLSEYPEVFVMGQGLWSPWYVGNSMTDLDKIYGTDRVIDTPVSELACTGAGVGASLAGMRPVVVHPRIDFMLYALDAIVNQAAKWSHMFGGQAHPRVTVRGIINRGGEQGAQHSQALHSWFAHIPGLRVVMPATVADARDLLIASVLCDDPVVFIDDRWLYDLKGELPAPKELDLRAQGPVVVREGVDITLVASGYSTQLALEASEVLLEEGISCEVLDLRVIAPLDPAKVIRSVSKTGRLVAIDGGWRTCGLSSEILAQVVEHVPPNSMKANCVRVTLPDAPAPTSRVLEGLYYSSIEDVVAAARSCARNG